MPEVYRAGSEQTESFVSVRNTSLFYPIQPMSNLLDLVVLSQPIKSILYLCPCQLRELLTNLEPGQHAAFQDIQNVACRVCLASIWRIGKVCRYCFVASIASDITSLSLASLWFMPCFRHHPTTRLRAATSELWTRRRRYASSSSYVMSMSSSSVLRQTPMKPGRCISRYTTSWPILVGQRASISFATSATGPDS